MWRVQKWVKRFLNAKRNIKFFFPKWQNFNLAQDSLNEAPMYFFRNCNVPIPIFPLLTLASVAYGKLALNPGALHTASTGERTSETSSWPLPCLSLGGRLIKMCSSSACCGWNDPRAKILSKILKCVYFPFNFHRIHREQNPFSTSYSPLGWAWKTFPTRGWMRSLKPSMLISLSNDFA